jgi:hypothetical protein
MRVKTLISRRRKGSPSKSTKTDTSEKRSRDETDDAGQSSSSPTPSTPPNPANEWKKAKLEDLLALVNICFLREKEMDLWSTAAGDPYPMKKNLDEIPMFARFVERGLTLPANDFFKGMLM